MVHTGGVLIQVTLVEFITISMTLAQHLTIMHHSVPDFMLVQVEQALIFISHKWCRSCGSSKPRPWQEFQRADGQVSITAALEAEAMRGDHLHSSDNSKAVMP